MNKKEIIDELCDKLPEGLHSIYTVDGHDDAIIGFDKTIGRVVYSKEIIIENLIFEGLTEEEAIEHFEYNIQGSYIGKGTPLYVSEIEE